ncbi:MAG: hypothetical protein K5696_00945 [Lachnospiraceae bacterium]|nr:hypothetical protein [Lachnospiraceae bacterium]
MIPITRKPEEYAELIDYEYHGTTTHVPMPTGKRAAQFAPFAALSGMDEKYEEENRVSHVFELENQPLDLDSPDEM